MKKQVIHVKHKSGVGLLTTVEFTPNWLEYLFRRRRYEKKYFSEYGHTWHHADTGADVNFMDSVLKPLREVKDDTGLNKVRRLVDKFREKQPTLMDPFMQYKYFMFLAYHEILIGRGNGQDLFGKAHKLGAINTELYRKWREFVSTYGIGIHKPDKVSQKRLTLYEKVL